MLNIYFGEMPEAIYDTSTYFKHVYRDEWIMDPLSVEMIRDVDRSEVIGSHLIQIRFSGLSLRPSSQEA